jgi:hypothetical protein
MFMDHDISVNNVNIIDHYTLQKCGIPYCPKCGIKIDKLVMRRGRLNETHLPLIHAETLSHIQIIDDDIKIKNILTPSLSQESYNNKMIKKKINKSRSVGDNIYYVDENIDCKCIVAMHKKNLEKYMNDQNKLKYRSNSSLF